MILHAQLANYNFNEVRVFEINKEFEAFCQKHRIAKNFHLVDIAKAYICFLNSFIKLSITQKKPFVMINFLNIMIKTIMKIMKIMSNGYVIHAG